MVREDDYGTRVLGSKTFRVVGGPRVHLTEFVAFDASLFLNYTPLTDNPEVEGYVSVAEAEGTRVVFSRNRISEFVLQYELSFSGAEGPIRLRIVREIEEQLGKSSGLKSWNVMDNSGSSIHIDGRMWQVHMA